MFFVLTNSLAAHLLDFSPSYDDFQKTESGLEITFGTSEADKITLANGASTKKRLRMVTRAYLRVIFRFFSLLSKKIQRMTARAYLCVIFRFFPSCCRLIFPGVIVIQLILHILLILHANSDFFFFFF